MGAVMRRIILTLPLMLALGSSVKALDGASFSCPQEIALDKAGVRLELPEWSVRPDMTPYLTGADVFDGDPRDLASLVPTSDRRVSKELSIVVWTLNGDYPRGKWAVCRYEPGAFYLTRRLPDPVTRCEVQWRTLKTARRGELKLDFRCD